MADEVYARIVYDGAPAAPSFLELAEPDDPLVVVNSFSKAWAMTGWRIGWMIMPARLTAVVDKLIEFNTSGAQPFLQHACAVALTQGEPFVAEMVARYRTGRELVLQRLGAMPRVRIVRPEAAFYVMFGVDGMTGLAGLRQADGARGLTSASPPAAPSAPAARATCASASPPASTACRRPWTGWSRR